MLMKLDSTFIWYIFVVDDAWQIRFYEQYISFFFYPRISIEILVLLMFIPVESIILSIKFQKDE